MWFLIIGLVLIGLKLAGIEPVAELTWDSLASDWWVFALPFAAAMVWWAWADRTGWTQRKAAEREKARREDRRQRQLDALGRSSGKRPS
jgi:small Trp-rich protein